MFPVLHHQYTLPLFFLRDHNGNKVTLLFGLSMLSHLMEKLFTTIFNFDEFIFVYDDVNIRLICDGKIYLLDTP